MYVEPSLTQLAAMAREDETSLASIANFKVGHRRYGAIVWREPVDVRGLDVDRAVSFSKSSVEVPARLSVCWPHFVGDANVELLSGVWRHTFRTDGRTHRRCT